MNVNTKHGRKLQEQSRQLRCGGMMSRDVSNKCITEASLSKTAGGVSKEIYFFKWLGNS